MRPELDQKPRRHGAYRLALHGLLCLSLRTQDPQPRGVTAHEGLPPLMTAMKKMHRRLRPQGNLVGTFSQLRAFLLSSDSSLYLS